MNAAELIEYIRTAEKKTPVKVYIWERFPTSFPNGKVFPAGDGAKIVFGDWRDIGPAIEAQQDAIADIVIESSCRNSAVPLLDTKDLRARIEPGAIIREQVEIGAGAVIMMGAIINIGASVGAGTMIDMGAVLGGRATVGARCHIGAGAVLAGVIEPASALPVVVEDEVLIGSRCGGRGRHLGRTARHRGCRMPRAYHQAQGRVLRRQDGAGGRPAGALSRRRMTFKHAQERVSDMQTLAPMTVDRRALHRIPELGDELPKTMDYVQDVLGTLDCEVFFPLDSAVCAYFDFGAADTLAFRAEMDALPIAERTGLPFASQHSGKMHACGHDGHMAMVLELGRRIRTKQVLPHNILLLFQPAEETTGGARRLCETGVLERLRVKAVFALHLWPGLSAGMIAGLPGAMMARSAEVTFTAEGRCAHFCSAASGRDALAACVEFYSRAAALPLPQAPQSLLGFGRMEAGSVRNAVAGSARLEGSLRALDDAAFCSIQEALETISRHVAQTSGCAAAVHFSEGYPAVVNPPDLLRMASALFPIEALTAPTMASDDFSYYQRRLPGLFLFLGCGETSALHTAAFDFDERVLEAGVRYFETVAGGAVW